MITKGLFEAKSCLGQLVDRVAAGEIVILTRRGKPVAEIRAPRVELAREDAAQAVAAMRRFRGALRVGAFDRAEFVAEGRR